MKTIAIKLISIPTTGWDSILKGLEILVYKTDCSYCNKVVNDKYKIQ